MTRLTTIIKIEVEVVETEIGIGIVIVVMDGVTVVAAEVAIEIENVIERKRIASAIRRGDVIGVEVEVARETVRRVIGKSGITIDAVTVTVAEVAVAVAVVAVIETTENATERRETGTATISDGTNDLVKSRDHPERKTTPNLFG